MQPIQRKLISVVQNFKLNWILAEMDRAISLSPQITQDCEHPIDEGIDYDATRSICL